MSVEEVSKSYITDKAVIAELQHEQLVGLLNNTLGGSDYQELLLRIVDKYKHDSSMLVEIYECYLHQYMDIYEA
jgi:hypothetical protein